jgi:Glycosyltransferase family 87
MEALRAGNEIMARRRDGLRKRTPIPQVAVATLWLLVGLGGCLWLGPLCAEAMRPEPDRVNDFYQDWGSARNHLVGLPVYTHHATSIPRHLGVPFDSVTSVAYNAHPPTSVLLALPLARLDYPDAVLVWNTISVLALLVSLAIVAATLPVPRELFLPALALLTFCHPVYGNLYQAQLTLVLVLLVTAIWALERSGRSSVAGLVLGTAAAIKLFPAYLAVYYAARGRSRSLVAAALSFLALTCATAVVLGLDAYHDYVQVVLPAQSQFRSLGYNYAVAGLWHRLFDPIGERGWMTPLWPRPALARWGTLLSDLGITAVVAIFAHRARTRAKRDLAFASTVSAMLLVSPVTWDTSLPLLLVPIAVIARSSAMSRWRFMPAALVLIVAVVWSPQQMLTKLALAGRTVHVASWAFMLGAPSLKFYALLAIFILGLAAFSGEKGEEKEEVELTGAFTRAAPHTETSPASLAV